MLVVLFVSANSCVSLSKSWSDFSWGSGEMGADVLYIYHGDGLSSEGLGRTTGILVIRLYLGGACSGGAVGLGVVFVLGDAEKSA